jgi:hypothetical protein
MLDKIKEQNSKKIVDHFNNFFKGKYEVECNWGFPMLVLSFSSSEKSLNNFWKITIDVVTTGFNVDMKSYSVVEGKESPEWSGIDSQTLGFIMQETLKISKEIFSIEEVPNP